MSELLEFLPDSARNAVEFELEGTRGGEQEGGALIRQVIRYGAEGTGLVIVHHLTPWGYYALANQPLPRPPVKYTSGFESLFSHIEGAQPLPRSAEFQKSAKRVASRVPRHPIRNITKWAKQLAKDVFGAND